MAPQKQVREIEIRVNTRGNPEIKKLASEFGKLNKGVRDFSSTLSTLKNAFFAIQGFTFAGIGLSTLTQTADALQKLTDRLTLSEGSLEAANIQLGKLGDVANATNSRIEDVATVYSRLNLSLRDAGVSSEALLATTKALQNTFRLSGSTAAEATAATIQLSQGLASGQVRGQELRSVLEQNALIGEILAKRLGIARGELLKFAEKNGGIKASEVLGAIADNFKDIDDRASKLQPTISEGLDKAFNGLKLKLNNVNQELGLTAKAIGAIETAASNLDGLAAFALALGGYLALPKIIAGLTFLAAKIGTLVGLIGGLAGAFLALNPVTIATVGIFTSLVSIFGLATVRSGALSDAFNGLAGSINEELFPNVVRFLKYLGEFGDKSDSSKKKLEDFSGQAKELFNVISGNNTPMKGIFEYDKESPIEKQVNALKRAADAMEASKKEVFDFKKELSLLNNKYLEGSINVGSYNKALRDLEVRNLKQEFSEGSMKLEDYNKKLKEIMDGKAIKSSKLLELNMKQLNAEFESGKLSIQQYAMAINNAEFDKLGRDVKDGKANILEFNQATRDRNLQALNRELAQGAMSFSDYKEASQGIEIGKLNEELQTGVISLTEYDNKISQISDKLQPGSALRSGLQGYLESSGTLSENIAKGIENTFNRLEDYLFDFIKTGTFEFKKFAQAILDDLTKIIIRAAIVRPLAAGILDMSGLGTPAATPNAHGNVYDGGLKKFASGGVVDSPTYFGYGSGKRGLMGEAGAEGILPLKRTSNGDLGVQTTGGSAGAVIVNVYNQGSGDAEVTQQERTNSDGTRTLDIYIKNKMKQSLSDGSLDSVMNLNYGAKRRSS